MTHSHRIHRWFSQNVALPWMIHGPWTSGRRKFRIALKQAKAGFQYWEQADPESRRKWILQELRKIVCWSGTYVPYYRELFQKIGFDPCAEFSFADYRMIPPLDKEIIRTRSADLIAEGFSRDTMMANSTGGSTGEPTRFWLDEESLGWRDAASEWAYSHVRFQAGDRLGLIWGAPQANSQAYVKLKNRVIDWLVHQQTNDCCRLSPEILDQIDKRLSAYQPDFLRCYASALTVLAKRLLERNRQPTYPKGAIITGAEGLENTDRQIIERVFKAPVYETYGSRDCGLMAMQRSAFDKRLHIAGANVLLEPYGLQDPVSGHEIVVTNLHGRGMPFLRYRIGDCGRFPADLDDYPVTMLEELTGRVVDHIFLPNGHLVRLQFLKFFKNFDIREYQVVQEINGNVRVQIVSGPHFNSSDLGRIENILSDELRGVSVSIDRVSSIERTSMGKLRPIISKYSMIKS